MNIIIVQYVMIMECLTNDVMNDGINIPSGIIILQQFKYPIY